MTAATTDAFTGSKLETALANLLSNSVRPGLMGDVHIHAGDDVEARTAATREALFTESLAALADASDAELITVDVDAAGPPPHNHDAELREVKEHWLTHDHAEQLVETYFEAHEDGHTCVATEHVAYLETLLEVTSELDFTRGETAIFLANMFLEAEDRSHEAGKAEGINETLELAFKVAASYPGKKKSAVAAVGEFPTALVTAALGAENAIDWMLAFLNEFPQDVVNEAVEKVLNDQD